MRVPVNIRSSERASNVDRVEDVHAVREVHHVEEVAVAQLPAEPATSVVHLMDEYWP